MTDTDKAAQVESEERGRDCLTPSAAILALVIVVVWAVARWGMA